MRKYEPLGIFLENTKSARVKLDFGTIEKIIGDHLPNSAKYHRPWWANEKIHGTRHVQSVDGWLYVGWRVREVNLEKEFVIFERID